MSVFVNYLHGRVSLEERVDAVRKRIGIESDPWNRVCTFLAPLRDKGPAYRFHYEHTLRVALLCVSVAEFMYLSEKVLFYAGLLHDIGKIQSPADTLGKMGGWTSRDSAIMSQHVTDSYRMLKGRFDFTAEVIIWHHQFQKNSYPKTMPKLDEYELGTKIMIPLYGRLLSLCDQYDALHRIDGHNGTVLPTGEGIKKQMIDLNLDQKKLIEGLYAAEIFTTYLDLGSLELV